MVRGGEMWQGGKAGGFIVITWRARPGLSHHVLGVVIGPVYGSFLQ
jgi:hypothetical protein